jgi:SAM-dependent methyltransferase
MKLNLGCGQDIRQGYVNLDIIKRDGVDVVHDLNSFPYPFADDSFDEIYTSHVLEHVDDVMRVLEELHRILAIGGTLIVKVPYYSSAGAFQDLTHKHFFADDTARLYIAGNAYARKFSFALVHQKLQYTLPFRYLPFRGLLRHVLLNVVHEMTIVLRATGKEARSAGTGTKRRS